MFVDLPFASFITMAWIGGFFDGFFCLVGWVLIGFFCWVVCFFLVGGCFSFLIGW